MKKYQVTRKLQVTIPKKIAEKIGIKPGDSIVFEEAEKGLLLRKASEVKEDLEELKPVIEEFAKDVTKIKPYVSEAEEAMIEGLSRHISSKRP
ncbi:MAG: AbrB/MazE/SpoVT family DNA-binding domain-containing protein [archaeon]|nr:AbrB/MazE/SpoVT family DNA-binding domain-containing protein [archaeon]